MDNIEAATTALISDDKLGRQARLYLHHRYSGATLKEIGSRFGMGESAVSQARRRFAVRIEKDEELKELIRKIEDSLKKYLV